MNNFKKSDSGLKPEILNSAGDIHNPEILFTEFDLPNNLHCILHNDSRIPVVNLFVAYDVGSKDEEQGKKGIAHLFEHLMFQGSENIKKNEHFGHILKSGGSCNAFTMQDATVYFDFMPSCNLDKALWLESDRMNSLDLTEENLENQKNVVIEEKKQRFENTPYGSLLPMVFENVFKDSNYESFTIGETEDIRSFSVREAVDFHRKYYSPGNAVLVLSGDFDPAKAETKIRKYFSGINKENHIIKKVNNISVIKEDADFTVCDNVQLPLLCIAWQLPGAGSEEDYRMEYFSEILANNKSSRLYRKLVYEQKLLKSVNADKIVLKDAGILMIHAELFPDSNIETAKKEIFNEINEIAVNGFTDYEFETIKNQIEFENTAKYLKLFQISLNAVFNYLNFKNISRINDEINKYLSVRKEDVVRSVNEYIINKKRISFLYLPKNFKK